MMDIRNIEAELAEVDALLADNQVAQMKAANDVKTWRSIADNERGMSDIEYQNILRVARRSQSALAENSDRLTELQQRVAAIERDGREPAPMPGMEGMSPPLPLPIPIVSNPYIGLPVRKSRSPVLLRDPDSPKYDPKLKRWIVLPHPTPQEQQQPQQQQQQSQEDFNHQHQQQEEIASHHPTRNDSPTNAVSAMVKESLNTISKNIASAVAKEMANYRGDDVQNPSQQVPEADITKERGEILQDMAKLEKDMMTQLQAHLTKKEKKDEQPINSTVAVQPVNSFRNSSSSPPIFDYHAHRYPISIPPVANVGTTDGYYPPQPQRRVSTPAPCPVPNSQFKIQVPPITHKVDTGTQPSFRVSPSRLASSIPSRLRSMTPDAAFAQVGLSPGMVSRRHDFGSLNDAVPPIVATASISARVPEVHVSPSRGESLMRMSSSIPVIRNHLPAGTVGTILDICDRGDHIMLRELISFGCDVEQKDSDGWTGLHISSQKGWDKCVRVLVEVAEIDSKDCDGSTPLIVASLEGNISCMKILLLAGSDYDATDCDGSTALMVASQASHSAAVDLLLRNGADPTRKDSAGRSALTCAQLSDSPECIAILERVLRMSNPPAPSNRITSHTPQNHSFI